MPLQDWRPDKYSDFGPATLTSGAVAPNLPLTVGADGHFYEGDSRFIVVSDHYIETNCGFASDADVAGVTKHSAALGVNMVRFLGWNNKAVATTGLYNLGCWTDQSGTGANNGAVVYGATYNEAFLVQMDKTIKALNDRGIRIWFAFDHGDKARIVAGLAPNSGNGSSSTKAANGDHGMMWSSEWNACYQAHISTILNRANTITGVAYKDNPMISVVAPFNENSFWDAATKPIADATYVNNPALDYIVLEVGGTSGGPSGGSGYWRTALDAHWNAYAAAHGFTWPVSRFPLYADWWAWGDTDKERMIDYICQTDIAAAWEYRTFFKGLAPHALYAYCDGTRYHDIRVQEACDIATLHFYSKLGSGLGSTVARQSSVDDVSSGNLITQYSIRLNGQAHVITESGQYSRNRNDADNEWFKGTVSCMQDADGLAFFCMWQNQFYSVVTGYAGLHYMSIWPSRRLGALFASPIIKHRLVAPLPKRVLTVDPDSIPSRVSASGNICQMGERAQAPVGDAQWPRWAWLKEALYSDLGTPEVFGADVSLNNAAIQAGTTVTVANGEFFYKGAGATDPTISWNFPGVMGQAITVDNGTWGKLTISGLAAPMKGIVAIRSSGNWEIGAGPSVLFLHGPTFQTDVSVDGNSSATNIDDFLAADGVNVTGGTQGTTRIWTPDAVTVTLADIGRNQRATGSPRRGFPRPSRARSSLRRGIRRPGR